MELFYAYKIEDGVAWLDAEESMHCIRVLRHRPGDEIAVISGSTPDASGALYFCVITEDLSKGVKASVRVTKPNWGGHPYYLQMAVCPTKNIDRYEWFVEKAVELGVDEIVPVIGEHSERRVVRVDRLQKIAVAAAKQSLKGRVPAIAEPVSVRSFVAASNQDIRLIAYCSDDVSPRGSIVDALAAARDGVSTDGKAAAKAPRITVLIGPEGDFSKDEVRAAMAAGFAPVHLGPSRLRTETAAITAVEAVYFTLGLGSPAYDSEALITHLADCQ